MLSTMVALLLQPRDKLPLLIVIDEFELGLHPFAIQTVTDLMREASHNTQILIATQSTSVLDRFAPEDTLVAERAEGETSFRRLSPTALDDWLEEYTLSELWEKNVLGGRPAR